MVQRKLPNKLGIQADHVKSEKRLGSLKPSSCQHQEGKNRGTDLKRKMKKSRSIKLSDIESLRSSSSPLRKTIAQPGKPPPLDVPPAAAATPQKKPIVKAINGSPNYMKSTSSSEAKKDASQVSSRNTQTDSRRTSSTGSCNKPGRTLRRTSSLKLVRTLTKSPSFKPARASAKKCSKVALCTDIDVERATCSSTLKDSKFPAYLMLNPGGTESEGTSIIKVCPYTYCSLNGHHHTPLPPLKCFLKARRRSLKTQRTMKMEAALRQRRVKVSADGAPEEFNEEEQVDLGNSLVSSLMQEGPMDFFIEICAKSKGNDVEATTGSTGMDDSGRGNETAPENDSEKPVSEHLSEGSPRSEIDFDENLEHYGEIISKVDVREALHEELKQNNVDGEFRRILAKEEPSPWSFADDDKQEGVSRVDEDHTAFEVIDMEWEEEWQSSASEPDNEAHSSMESDGESDMNMGDLSENHRTDLLDISADESDSKIAKEIDLADGAEQVFEEDTACIETCSQVSETLCHDQVSSTEEMLVILVAREEEDEQENTQTGKEKMLENGEVSRADSPLEASEKSCNIDLKDESSESTEQFQLLLFEKDETNEGADQTGTNSDFCPEKELPSCKEGKVADGIQDSSHDDNVAEDKQNEQLCEVNNAIDESSSTQDTVDEGLLAESQDHLSDGQDENTHVVDNQSVLEEDQDEAKFKVPSSMDSEEQNSSRMHQTSLADGSEEAGKMELEDSTTPVLDVAETFPAATDKSCQKPRSKFSFTRSNAKDELPENNIKWRIGRKRHEENYDEPRKFNPREPNFLPVIPEPDAEMVDLRHQMMDERKNSEEWMLDHALQQAVTKLAPARKRKVALLVEAFETVLPVTKCDTHSMHTSSGFAHGRSIQTCN